MGSSAFFILIAIFGSAYSSMPLIVRDCASSGSPVVQLMSESISPNEVPIPGDLTVSGTIRVNRGAQEGGLDLDVHIQRYVGFLWITVPCISDVGSCKYDACNLLSTFQNTSCPAELVANNIPCTCDTIVPGDYSMQSQVFHIPKLDGLWSWLASGDYKVDLTLTDRASHTKVACMHAELTIVDPTACTGFLCSIFG